MECLIPALDQKNQEEWLPQKKVSQAAERTTNLMAFMEQGKRMS